VDAIARPGIGAAAALRPSLVRAAVRHGGATEVNPASFSTFRVMDGDTTRRGIRPHMHEPNRLWPWVFDQHQVWVDVHGTEHEIESMPIDYVGNVIRFCRRRAVWIYVLVADDRDDDELLDEESDELTLPEEIDFNGWLELTPLMRALRRRLDRPRR
jgi:hypothetical protein